MCNFFEYNNRNNLYLDFKKIIIDNLNNNNTDFIIIVPNNEIKKQLEKEILDTLEVVLDLKIFVFDEFISYTNINSVESNNNILFNELILKYCVKECIYGNLIENNYFYNSVGFSHLALRFINYLRSSLITPEIFKEKTVNDSSLFSIALIYEKYTKYLEIYQIKDRYDKYYSFFDLIDNTSYLEKIKSIYIVGFVDFRLIEYKVIESIKKHVNIELFYYKSLEKENLIYLETVNSLKKMNFNYERKYFESYNPTEFKIVEAEDKYLEVKRLAIEIKKNIFENYTENHCIVINDEEYMDIIIDRFKKEEIPLNFNSKISLLNSEYGKNIYMIFNKDIDLTTYIIRNLKNTLIFQDIIEDYELEKLLREIKFDCFDELFKSYIFINNINYDKYTEFLEKIYRLYKLKDKKEIQSFILYKLNNYMDENNKYLEIYTNFCDFINRLFKDFEDIITDIDDNSFNKFIIEIISEFSCYENTSFHSKISLIKFDDYKLLNYDNIYILGCDDNNFPKIEKSNFYFNRNTFNRLKEFGMDLLNSKMISSRDELNFSNIINNENSKIYISYSSNGDSIITEFILDKLEDVKIEKYSLKDYIQPNIDFVINDYDKSRYVYSYNNINNKNIKSSLNNSTNNSKKHSTNFTVTELETFQSCPIKYYFKYILTLKDQFRKKEDRKKLDIGTACHESLKLIYGNYNIIKEGHSLLIDKIIELLKKEFQKLNYNINNKEIITIIERYSYLLNKLILEDIKFLNNHDIELYPYKFEKDILIDNIVFNINGKNENLKIKGRIDRIDKDSNGNFYLVDYKLGKSSIKKIKDFEDNKTLQFPIYSLIENVVGCRYLTINDSSTSIFYELNNNESNSKDYINKVNYKVLKDSTINKIEGIITRIRNDDFYEGTKYSNNCRYCEYLEICDYRS